MRLSTSTSANSRKASPTEGAVVITAYYRATDLIAPSSTEHELKYCPNCTTTTSAHVRVRPDFGENRISAVLFLLSFFVVFFFFLLLFLTLHHHKCDDDEETSFRVTIAFRGTPKYY